MLISQDKLLHNAEILFYIYFKMLQDKFMTAIHLPCQQKHISLKELISVVMT